MKSLEAVRLVGGEPQREPLLAHPQRRFQAATGEDPRGVAIRRGVQPDRLNQNQGAESTLAFLLSQAEMTLLENTLAAFEQPPEAERLEDAASTEIAPGRSSAVVREGG